MASRRLNNPRSFQRLFPIVVHNIGPGTKKAPAGGANHGIPTSLYLLIGFFFLVASSYGTPRQNQSRDLVDFLSVARGSGLTSEGITPWHIRVRFRGFDAQGQNPVDGVFEEWWAGPLQNRRSFAKQGYSHVEYVTRDGISYLGRPTPIYNPESALLWTLIDPLPEKEMIQDLPLTDVLVSVGGSPMHCITVHQQRESHSAGPEPPAPEFCFQPDKPMLRISSPDGAGRQVTYNHIFLFQNRYIAGEVHYSINGSPLLQANVEVLEKLESIDPALFTPASAATRIAPKKIVLDAKVVERYRIKSATPEPVWEDNPFNLQGVVVLSATVGLQGRVDRVDVVSGLPSLRAPAIDLLKHAVFRPVIVNADPAEVEFVKQTVFRNGSAMRPPVPTGFGGPVR